MESSPVGEDFESWFLTNGGYLNPAVELASDDNDGNFVRVKQHHVLSPGSVVVSCPHQLIIPSLATLNQICPQDIRSIFTPHVATRLFLIKQRLLKKQSSWWPYINSLPRSFSTPLWYDENDLIWLRGTNLGKAKEIREEAWRQEYEKAMQSLFANGSDSQQKHLWTWELYLWAATVMTTRSFAGPTSFNRDGDFVVASDDGGRCPILIPGLDLLNHNSSAKISWIWDANSCALKAQESKHGGCQVWNNYDSKSNEELIMGYGFSFPDNTSDHYSLGFSPAVAAYIRAVRARRLACKLSWDAVRSQSTKETNTVRPDQSRGTIRSGGAVIESSEDFNVEEILEQNIHWVRLLENESYEFSPQFLENFSIAVENPREARRADDCLIVNMDFSGRDFSRNKLHVICAITMILQKGRRAIRKHDKNLPPAPRNGKQVDAARYRNSQLRILDGVLNSMYTFLESVTTAKLPETSNTSTLRLEHIFMDLPKSLLKDLRGVLNAGIRTRDPVKIRERGGVDFAFTTWLCGLWIYSQPSSKQEDEINRTMFRWLHFLRQNYAEPLEESSDQPKPENSILEERAEWFDPVRNTNGNAAMESAAIAKSYLEAVQASTKKHPQSMYNDNRITVRRLEWCLNIIRKEGVWYPSLDKGEDEEDDDWVIVLELGDP